MHRRLIGARELRLFHPEIELFDFLTSPGRFAQEFKAGFDRGVGVEAIDKDATA